MFSCIIKHRLTHAVSISPTDANVSGIFAVTAAKPDVALSFAAVIIGNKRYEFKRMTLTLLRFT